jgi:hypothetical protein
VSGHAADDLLSAIACDELVATVTRDRENATEERVA